MINLLQNLKIKNFTNLPRKRYTQTMKNKEKKKATLILQLQKKYQQKVMIIIYQKFVLAVGAQITSEGS